MRKKYKYKYFTFTSDLIDFLNENKIKKKNIVSIESIEVNNHRLIYIGKERGGENK